MIQSATRRINDIANLLLSRHEQVPGTERHNVVPADELFAALSHIRKTTPIYVDFNLLGSSGAVVTKDLVARGYAEVYLVTGESLENLPPMPWVTAILSKSMPILNTQRSPSRPAIRENNARPATHRGALR